MERKLVIHGHFYQPPRTNPWTGALRREASATPFNNWNERINEECYHANAFSRVLDDQKRLLLLVNNYQYLNYDIGPTLLNWIKEYDPAVYLRMLEGTDEGVRKSALAHPYFHCILPLLNRQKKEAIIQWGISYFEEHFGWKPEGMWLPEAAIDEETVAVLLEKGIKFVVLSPHQADFIRPSRESEWIKFTAESTTTCRPYRLYYETASSSNQLVAFFFNGPISRALSFGNLLYDSKNLSAAVKNEFESIEKGKTADEETFLLLATDGETFGHHHPSGDMCLAAFFTGNHHTRDYTITTLADLFHEIPATWEMKLKPGPTSWSCIHGIDRWQKHCGCETGGQPGWNQDWRRPLRSAFHYCEEVCDEIFTSELIKLDQNPQKLLETIRPDQMKNFNGPHLAVMTQKPGDGESEAQKRIKSLLEMQYNSLRMFTSCAWFFADLDGLEAKQNMLYCARALEIAHTFSIIDIEKKFLAHLAQAESNKQKTGKQLYEELLEGERFSFLDYCTGLILWDTFIQKNEPDYLQSLSITPAEKIRFTANGHSFVLGRLFFEKDATHAEVRQLLYIINPEQVDPLTLYIVAAGARDVQLEEIVEELPHSFYIERTITLNDLIFHRVSFTKLPNLLISDYLFQLTSLHLQRISEGLKGDDIKKMIEVFHLWGQSNLSLPKEASYTLGYLIDASREKLLNDYLNKQVSAEDFQQFSLLVNHARQLNLKIEWRRWPQLFRQLTKEITTTFSHDADHESVIAELRNIIRFCKTISLPLDLRPSQEIVFAHLTTITHHVSRSQFPFALSAKLFEYISSVINIAELMNFNVIKWRKFVREKIPTESLEHDYWDM